MNLLPLPHLDGTALLGALLDLATSGGGFGGRGAGAFDFSALEAGAGGAANWDPEARRRRGTVGPPRAGGDAVGNGGRCGLLCVCITFKLYILIQSAHDPRRLQNVSVVSPRIRHTDCKLLRRERIECHDQSHLIAVCEEIGLEAIGTLFCFCSGTDALPQYV